MSEQALEGCRVLDLTDHKGALCGKILGDLGADVVKVEPPEGDASRRIGPFYHNINDAEFSLQWFSLNVNKRSITLNLEKEEGKELFSALVETANIVLESFEVGYLQSLGLDYPALKRTRPDIIMTSISPFGQAGPYRNYRISDIVAQAMSGFTYMIGDPDRPPLRVSVPQAHLHAGGQAAIATSIAYYYWLNTGEGQCIDVAIHGSMTGTTFNAVPFWELGHRLLERSGPYRQGMSTTSKQKELWKCQDGFVAFILIGGATGAKTNQKLVEWMAEEHLAPDQIINFDWSKFDQSSASPEIIEMLDKHIADFFLAHTMAELYKGAAERKVMLTPVATPKELLECPQLKAGSYWERIEHPKWGEEFYFPTPAARLSGISCRLMRRAPLLGEHNSEIYSCGLGISPGRLAALKENGVI